MRQRIMVSIWFGLTWLAMRGMGQQQEYARMPYSAELKKQAAEGNADAQCILGLAYADGNGIPQDKQEAFAFYIQAAKQGNAWAQNKVGYYYAQGIGVEKNIEEAIAWYTKASGQGFPKAQTKLDILIKQSSSRTGKETSLEKAVFKDSEFFELSEYRLNIKDPSGKIQPYDSIFGRVAKKNKDSLSFQILNINLGKEPENKLKPRNNGNAGNAGEPATQPRDPKDYLGKTITIEYWQIIDKSAL